MYYIGIDIGTSSVKVLALDDNGQVVGTRSSSYPVYYENPFWSEQEPTDWWEGTKIAVKGLLESCQIADDQVASIGLSGQMHGLVSLDQKGDCIRRAILWNDQRTTLECEELTEQFGQELIRLTGNVALTGFTAPKLLWLKKNQPQQFARIKHILLPKDYIRYRLTGDYATDVSDASGTLLFDVENKAWSEPILNFIGLDLEALPKVYESYEVTGHVSQQAKQELGLSGEIAVVGGGSDQAAAAVGSGAVDQGAMSISLGTSGVVFIAHDHFRADIKGRTHSFCHANGTYHTMGVMLSAAGCLSWWVDNRFAGDYEQALSEIDQIPVGSQGLLFLPYLTGERTPYPDPYVRGTFTGINPNTSRQAMTRSILEGVCLGLYDNYLLIEQLGLEVNQVRVVGGGTKSRQWVQILADVLGSDLNLLNTGEGASLGAAILAAVGSGRYQTVSEACKEIIDVADTIYYQPDNHQLYQKLHQRYKSLYASLKDWYADFGIETAEREQ